MSSLLKENDTLPQSAVPYRVMVVDDSAIIRGFLCRYLSEDPAIEVVTTANNGKVALQQLDAFDVDVVVLDIEMPEMDGLTALPKMLEKKPNLKVVMASTLTLKNAEISMRAMQMGAADYVPKPESARSVNASTDFKRELVGKVKAWASVGRRKGSGSKAAKIIATDNVSYIAPIEQTVHNSQHRHDVSDKLAGAPKSASSSATQSIKSSSGKLLTLRQGSRRKPEVMVVGSSTGGPQALPKFFSGFEKQPDVPILLTQHMPATFTNLLAQHLGLATGWPAEEGADGTIIKPGHIYVAPGGRHMEVVRDGPRIKLHISDAPPENFCRPAVDLTLRSAGAIYGERILAVILTGMGQDGLKGCRGITEDGATVLAQDEASSVVWGMPGAVATDGICSEILPLTELGAAASRWLQGEAR